MVLAFTFYLQPPHISTSHKYMHAPSHTYSFCLSRYKWEARSGREKFTKFLFRKVNPTRWEDGKTKCIFLIWEFVSSFYAYVLLSALLCVVCLFGAFFWKEKRGFSIEKTFWVVVILVCICRPPSQKLSVCS